MGTLVVMPRRGQYVETCILSEWHKQVGDPVSEGEPLFTFETDKAEFTENAPCSGELLATLFEEGDDVPCLQGVCVIGTHGEDPSAYPSAETTAAASLIPAPSALQVSGSEVSSCSAVPVSMPRRGQYVEVCVLSEWHKQVGDPVKAGDPLFNFETDKAEFTEYAPCDGEILSIHYNAGDDVPCLETVCVIGGSQAAVSAAAYCPLTSVFALTSGGITPRAKKLAAEFGIDAAAAVPSGPEGRITACDILALKETLLQASSDWRAYTSVPMSSVRKTIAKSMTRSLSEMAQLTESTSFDATALLALKEQCSRMERDQSLPRITLNHLLLFAVSRILPDFPDLNAHCVDQEIRHFQHVNLGMAVDAPRGLLVPVIFGAEKLSLPELAAQASSLAEAAKTGSIEPDLLTGGSFSVTNLGMLGIETFTPIINPPQTAILGVGCTVQRPRYGQSGGIILYPSMTLSLTVDHRAVDGAYAARFLKQLTNALENISALLL